MFDEDYDDCNRSRNRDSAWIICVAFFIFSVAVTAKLIWHAVT